MLTPKNNPLFDVVATSLDGMCSATIQVKTRSIHNKLGWKLGAAIANLGKSNGQFIVLVNLHETLLPDFYVYTCEELANRVNSVYEKYISTPKRDGSPRKQVGFRWFDEVNFTSDDHARKNDWAAIRNALKTA